MTELLKSGEVARKLQVSCKTLRSWCDEGSGPAHLRTPGGHIRFRPEDVESWLNERQVCKKESE